MGQPIAAKDREKLGALSQRPEQPEHNGDYFREGVPDRL